jgi:hypothetical protein
MSIDLAHIAHDAALVKAYRDELEKLADPEDPRSRSTVLIGACVLAAAENVYNMLYAIHDRIDEINWRPR